VLFAGQHLHATAQQDFHIASAHTFAASVGEGASWFSHSGGIKSIAQAGSHTIQAHTDTMEILADQSVTITSSNDEIHILAKEKIVLQAGQSSVTLEGQNITFACPGTFSVKGSNHAFVGPGSSPAELAALPQGNAEQAPNWIEIAHHDADGEAFADQGYKIHFQDGSIVSGQLDSAGFAHHDNVPKVASHVEYEPRQPERDKPWDPLDELINAAQQKLG
jgi:type VI secretion system secreted protein VgrG